MAETERQRLARLTEIVRTWKPERSASELEAAFIELEQLDRSKNIDLWLQLKVSFGTNIKLNDPDVLALLRKPALARKGFWWYNPQTWLPA